MSCCGITIKPEEIVDLLVELYGDRFVEEIIKKLDLSQFVKANGGVANDLTLRQSLTVDENVKANLCSILQDCITTRVEELLSKCEGNEVVKFYIDKAKDQMVIDLKHGESYSISRAEIEGWLQVVAGGIKAGVLVRNNVDPKQVLHITNNDGSVVDIDVSSLSDVAIVGGVLINKGNTLQLRRSDNQVIDIDMTDRHDIYVECGELINNGNTLRLHRSDNTEVDIALDGIGADTYVTSGSVFVGGNDDRSELRLTRNDGVVVTVSLQEFQDYIIQRAGAGNGSGSIDNAELIALKSKVADLTTRLEALEQLTKSLVDVKDLADTVLFKAHPNA